MIECGIEIRNSLHGNTYIFNVDFDLCACIELSCAIFIRCAAVVYGPVLHCILSRRNYKPFNECKATQVYNTRIYSFLDKILT